MAHEATYSTEKKLNFLESAVGIVLKTCTVSAESVTADGRGNKMVKAGTIWPANNGTAKGILYHDVDVTEGEHEASLMVAGRVFKDMLPTELDTEAQTALEAIGIKFFETQAVTRPALDVVS